MKYIFSLLVFCFSFNLFADITEDDRRARQFTFTRGTANLEVKEVSSVQCRADVSGNLGGKYFVIYSALNAVKYGIWYDTGSSTAPTVTGATLVKVTIIADDTGTTVATNTKTALDAITGTPFVTSRLTDTLTITNSGYGATTDIADGDTAHTAISRTTNGVSTAAAIVSTNVIGDLRGFQVCNDAVNTSTYLIVGWVASTINDTGTRLGKGKCFDCEDCSADVLSTMNVSSEANSNGFSIVQFKE